MGSVDELQRKPESHVISAPLRNEGTICVVEEAPPVQILLWRRTQELPVQRKVAVTQEPDRHDQPRCVVAKPG